MSRGHFLFSGMTILAAVTLAGCQTFSPDGGMWLPAEIAGRHLNKKVVAIRTEDEAAAAHARVGRLVRRPLTAETAVQIALLNNRGLQAAYNDLGIAETVRVQQSLPPNPKLSIRPLSSSVETEIESQERRDERRTGGDQPASTSGTTGGTTGTNTGTNSGTTTDK